jgi:hypothetical protein
MKNFFATFLLAAALIGAAQPAAAQSQIVPDWSTIASACTPDSVSIQDNRYKSSPDNFVAPQAQKIDPIALICPVTSLRGSPDYLSMTYLDPVGAGTSVKARLIRVNRTNGARVVIATVDSNAFPTQAGVSTRLVNLTHLVDFDANFYFVRIEMDRTGANQNVRVIGVALESELID